MNNNNNTLPRVSRGRLGALTGLAAAVTLAIHAPGALAGDTVYFDNGATLDWNLTTSYGIGMRVDKPSRELTADRNADDGNRNFDQHSLTTNQVSALAEMIVRKDNYGAVLRASTFYDDVYHKKNDNDSPATVNKSGDNDEFTSDTKYYSGGRSRFLDAYVFGGWNFGEAQRLDLNAGRHVVSWGESLFYPGVSGAQSPSDAVKAALPGVEVKEIFLPVGQVSGLWTINDQFSLGGYYQYEWLKTELPPVGSYLSTSDVVGPGREFIGFNLLGQPRQIRYAGTDEPRDEGQWGVQARFRPNYDWEFSVFHLNYHDKNPAGVTQQIGQEDIGGLLGLPPGLVFANVPQTYRVKYFEDIKATGASVSTRIGDVQLSGEWSYRDGAPINVLSAAGTPVAVRGKGQQAQVSFIYLLGNMPWASQTTFSGEIVNVRADSADRDASGSDDFTYHTATARQTKSASAYTMTVALSYPGVFSGWDLTVPVNFSHVFDGYTPMIGAIAGGEGDRRLSVGTTFKRLGNLELAAKYNAFLGDPDPIAHKLADRDYMTLSAKYSF
ncbi:DUF1302 domain-containing protein [Pseudomonas jinjuensis]|uniref:DUF1302 domain-containing protein n=1 Tax=Pseudomonas jinjuensis TaxID=198616 RepID=A0A1H0PC14_9PSED|nr:DUF1302 family protein [Pseudomonas jinjuensis]SDP02541.1 Protein of unknown function [Pseudomonas jinjuensis]